MALLRVFLIWVGWPCAVLGPVFSFAATMEQMDPKPGQASPGPFLMVSLAGVAMIVAAWIIGRLIRADAP